MKDPENPYHDAPEPLKPYAVPVSRPICIVTLQLTEWVNRVFIGIGNGVRTHTNQAFSSIDNVTQVSRSNGIGGKKIRGLVSKEERIYCRSHICGGRADHMASPKGFIIYLPYFFAAINMPRYG